WAFQSHRCGYGIARYEQELIDAVGMLQRVFRRDPSALRISADDRPFNTKGIHERFELVDPALYPFAGRIIGIRLAESADAIKRVNLKLGCQGRHQLPEAGFARRARPAAMA